MNRINAFLHCKDCLKSVPGGISARDWARLEIGFTSEGLQIWCFRHDKNVLDIAFDDIVRLPDDYGEETTK